MFNFSKRNIRMLIGLCSWKNPKYLKKCIESLVKSIDLTLDAIVVVLNSYDKESMDLLLENNIPFIHLPDNRGVLAIDYLKPFIEESKYFFHVNDDMFFAPGFVEDLIDIIESNYPTTASCRLVENFNSGNSIVVVDENIKTLLDLDFDYFLNKCESYKNLNLPRIYTYNHPICIRSEDFLNTGGYSESWKPGYENGYSRDDAFAANLFFKLKYKFICSNKSFVFHESSSSMKRLPSVIKNNSNEINFIRDFGLSINQFGYLINRHQVCKS